MASTFASQKLIDSAADFWHNDDWKAFIALRTQATLTVQESVEPLSAISSAVDERFPLAIDHTLLKPETTPEQIHQLCDEAIRYGFKSCCVNGIYIKLIATRLGNVEGCPTIPCCVIGFPLGAGTAQSKSMEAKQAIVDGAKEIDTVIPIGLLRSPQPDYVEIYQHLRTIVHACQPFPVKVIIETALLPTSELKVAACVLAAEAGAAFVKTSTGFNGGGATKEDVELMWNAVKYKMGTVKVKASGGVRTFEACQEMFKAGAERIGTSSGVSIMIDARDQGPPSSDNY